MKKILIALILGLSIASPAFAAATTTPHSSSSSLEPVYFFNQLGLHVTNEVAAAAWQIDSIRKEVLALWRIKTFGN